MGKPDLLQQDGQVVTGEESMPALVDATFRNGSMTAIGVLLAFSLGFVNSWGTNPMPWRWPDLMALVPMFAGIVLQMRALYRLCHPDSLQLVNYHAAIRWWRIGILLSFLGVVLGLSADAFYGMTQQ